MKQVSCLELLTHKTIVFERVKTCLISHDSQLLEGLQLVMLSIHLLFPILLRIVGYLHLVIQVKLTQIKLLTFILL